MRVLTLCLLLWSGTLLQSLSAQSRLPAGLERYRADLSPVLLRALERSFPDFSAPTKSGVITKSFDDEMFLDSTITYEPFDVGGGNTVMIPITKTTYVQTNDTVLTVRESEINGENWEYVSEIRLTSDPLGRDWRQVAFRWDADLGTWIPDSRSENFFRGNSDEVLDSMYVEAYVEIPGVWERILTTNNTYDDEDRLVEGKIAVVLDELEESLTFLNTYGYNEEGDNDVVITSLLLGADTMPGSRTDMMYEDHKMTEALVSVMDNGGNFIPQNRVTYSYTADGLQDSIVTYDWNEVNEDWTPAILDNYDYEDGLLTDHFSTNYEPGGDHFMTWETSTYVPGTEYVQETKTFEYDHDAETYVPTESTTYFYSEATVSTPPVAVGASLKVWPNPAGDFLRVNFDEPAILHLFDQSGKLLYHRQYVPGEDIGLAGLPSGMYQVSLTTRSAQHRARVIKG